MQLNTATGGVLLIGGAIAPAMLQFTALPPTEIATGLAFLLSIAGESYLQTTVQVPALLSALGVQDLLSTLPGESPALRRSAHHASAFQRVPDQAVFERIQQAVSPGALRHGNGQLVAQRVQQIVRTHVRVGNVGSNALVLQGAQQLAAQHGFAATDLAHDLQEPFTATQRHQQGVERGLGAVVWEEKGAVGRDGKRRLAQGEMPQVHDLLH